MVANVFTTLIVQPIFNLLVLIYSILPGHNFGLAIIIFTIVVRLLMWPLVKKQLHQVKVMRDLQPEIKRIKKAAGGSKQQESLMMMELYKERGISPFGSIGILILQIPILIGLYSGLQRVLHDPHQLISFAYPALQNLPWLHTLGQDIHRFDATLFGVVDLTRGALGPKGFYLPAMLIVLASAVVQFFQSKQLSPSSKDARSLRTILKDAGKGKQADQSELNAATARSTRYLLPAMIFFFTVNIASALALYWLVSGVTALIQQTMVLRSDTEEMEAEADGKPADSKTVIEGEVIEKPAAKKPAKKKAAAKKRRKK
ncbi:MAG TPA: YidC/Oxa1 family membrane protein insertase [Patescibacteria group bacterium]|nr:YidC/Oxa1 family membrane protein insertase [Patescibacteria group bacterium]